jgi:hypothetical protein
MKRLTTLTALAALLICSACADNAKTVTLITPASQQVASVRWDETVAANTTAKVSNTSLIFMR